jgi:peptidoglycan hydrolase CwlO-like protein
MKKTLVALVCLLALSTPLVPARAGTVNRIRETISNLWNRNSNARHEARAARATAAVIDENADSLHGQLQKAGQAFLKANAVFLNSRRQIKRTEAQIVETRHRIQIVQARYEAHNKIFGARLASMQRNGQIGYLNVLLGSRTLSDLSRRAYLYQAIAERDADLQDQIKADREDLLTAQNALQAQWVERNKFQQAAMQERSRVILAQRENLVRWKDAQNKIYAQLAFSSTKAQSAKEARRGIYELEAERARLVEAYEAQQLENARAEERDRERERSRERSYAPRRSRRYRRRYTRSYQSIDESSYQRPSRRRYRRRYRRRSFTRVVKFERFVPSEGGVLKPMPIERLERKTIRVPVEPSGGPLSDDYVVQDAPN